MYRIGIAQLNSNSRFTAKRERNEPEDLSVLICVKEFKDYLFGAKLEQMAVLRLSIERFKKNLIY